MYPGSISDQQLTKKSGLIDLFEKGDSVMADRGFNIQDDLTPLGVRVNAKQKQPGCKGSARPIRSHNGYKRPKTLISSKAKKLNILSFYLNDIQ